MAIASLSLSLSVFREKKRKEKADLRRKRSELSSTEFASQSKPASRVFFFLIIIFNILLFRN